MEQLPQNSLTSSEKRDSLITDEKGDCFISVYKGELSKEVVILNIASIKKAFPALPKPYFDILIDRIKANNFTNQRLNDAVNFVLDNNIYPTPTIAQFISFDRRIQVFTHEQMTKKVTEYGPEIWNSYKAVKMDGMIKPVWIHVNDIEKYKIETL